MPAFLIDTQLPPILSAFLQNQQLDSKHTATDYLDGHLLNDKQVADLAVLENRILITKDKDFKDRFDVKGAPPKVVYLQLGNCSNNQLLSYFRKNLNEILQLIESGHLFIIGQNERIVAY